MQNKIIVIAIVMALVVPTFADPVWVQTLQSPLQDNWAINGEVEELSTAPHNPVLQLISSAVKNEDDPCIPCPQDYKGALPNVRVAITNMTQRRFTDLYYVGDVGTSGIPETTFTNMDEFVADVSPWHNLNVPGLAFKIDKVGVNKPLVFESMTQDQIFEPGETWEFIIQEYANILGLPASALGSVAPVGVAPFGAIAQASAGNTVSSGSIITPEPTILVLLSLSGVGLLRKRK